MIDAVVFRFRFADPVDPWRQKTEMRKCRPWAARGGAGIYRTRAVQLGLAPEQPRMDVILYRIDELPQFKAEQQRSRLSFNGKMPSPLGKTQPHTRARIKFTGIRLAAMRTGFSGGNCVIKLLARQLLLPKTAA